MSYVALYRKFRPSVFGEVKGQDAIVTTLRNQLRAGRVGHAYLFCGTRGTGKTTVAKILARAVNCEDPSEDGSPCNKCAACRSILSGTSTDVIEIDAASNNGVDNIREIRDEVVYRPSQGKYRVYIIDEAHMLSPGAWNALLKSLEEPPEYVIFMLATTEVHKIPVTILSRCQQYTFRRITTPVIASRIKDLLREENVEAEDEAVRYIARASDGSMRDALSLLDQCIAFYLGEKLTYGKVLDVLGKADMEVFSGLFRCIAAGDVTGCMRSFHGIIRDGRDVGTFVSDLTWYIRDLLLAKNTSDAPDLLDMSEEDAGRLRDEGALVPAETLMRYLEILSDLSGRLRASSQRQILVETTLIRLCRPQAEVDLSGVLDRIRMLEQKIEDGCVVTGRDGGEQRTSGPAGRPAQKEEAPPAPAPVTKAAPDDLKQIASRWKQIVSKTGFSLKAVLQRAGQPRYDSSTGDPVIYLEAADAISRSMIEDPQRMEELREAVAETMGKELEYTIKVSSPSEARSLEVIPLEEKLAREIAMPVEIL